MIYILTGQIKAENSGSGSDRQEKTKSDRISNPDSKEQFIIRVQKVL